MITKHAIQRFLDKPRRNLAKYKKLDWEQLDERMKALSIKPPIWYKLNWQQALGLLAGIDHRFVAYWYDTGTGKTLLSIALTAYLRKAKIIKRALVLSPYNVNRYEWQDEINKHAPSMHAIVLDGSTENKTNQLFNCDENTSFILATYTGFMTIVCDLVKNGKSKEYKINPKRLSEALQLFDCAIYDESLFLGNRTSIAFRIARQIRKSVKASFALCGTPFNRDPTPLWSQMFLIDNGESLGNNLAIFRAAFFKAVPNYFSGFDDYKFIESRHGELKRLLAHSSISVKAKAADLPPVVSITKLIDLPHEAEIYYEQAKRELRAAHGNNRLIQNAFLRMRQISSGFVGYVDDDTSAKAQYTFAENPKLDLLMSLVQSTLDHKLIIFHDFIYSGLLICKALDKLKINYARMFGHNPDADKQKQRFKQDTNCKIIVINTSGAFGLNLQIAEYGFFYESPPSSVLRYQMERRYIRQQSPHKHVFRYDLLVRKTVDQQIRAFHKQGRDLSKAILSGTKV